ncbi:YggS family pyridoxal phosphate-dependent enzyme [bacterium]|nr:YggS family pyridoxal phosphate-dependent enzyme [candidate division CSSED10-310 bacterium]
MSIRENVAHVMDGIARAAERSGRHPAAVTLVAVSKTFGPETIREAVAAGVRIFGENRLQEALDKMAVLDSDLTWHLVGHLQRNKAAKAVSSFHMIESIDSDRLLREVDKRAGQQARVMPVLFEVNVAGERSKTGMPVGELADLVMLAGELMHVSLRGLMVVPPYSADPEAGRPYFQEIVRLRDEMTALGVPGVDLRHLSMGMSNDFEVAIEEGATIVRVGTALFGGRR